MILPRLLLNSYYMPPKLCSPSEKKKGQNKPFSYPIEVVDGPLPLDVLCGKSRRCISHEGTRIFRMLIEQYRVKYHNAKSKQDRMEMTKEIVATIGKKARFLKFNRVTKQWEVSEFPARGRKQGE